MQKSIIQLSHRTKIWKHDDFPKFAAKAAGQRSSQRWERRVAKWNPRANPIETFFFFFFKKAFLLQPQCLDWWFSNGGTRRHSGVCEEKIHRTIFEK